MGLTMHSPGGIPGTSPAHMLGTEPWGSVHDVPVWVQVGVGAASLSLGGPLGKIARPVGGFALRQIQKAALKTAHGYRNPWVAYETLGELKDMADAIKTGITIYNIVEGSSSQDLVQNGGPPAPLQVSSTTADILSLGKISRPTRSSSAKRVIRPKSRKGRRKRAYALPLDTQYETWMDHNPCDRGYRPKRIKGRWHCVPIRKRS